MREITSSYSYYAGRLLFCVFVCGALPVNGIGLRVHENLCGFLLSWKSIRMRKRESKWNLRSNRSACACMAHSKTLSNKIRTCWKIFWPKKCYGKGIPKIEFIPQFCVWVLFFLSLFFFFALLVGWFIHIRLSTCVGMAKNMNYNIFGQAKRTRHSSYESNRFGSISAKYRGIWPKIIAMMADKYRQRQSTRRNTKRR